MRFVCRLASAVLLLATTAGAYAAPPAEGRWVLRTGGRPILLLELHKDPAAKGGWSGSYTRPKHFETGSNFMAFSNVEGPAGSETVVDATAHADSLDLTVQDSKSELTHFLWTPSDSGGSLKFTDFHFTALELAPAAADEHVPDVWDKGRTYSAVPEWPDNAELGRIFEADQLVRQEWPPADPNAALREDQARLMRTRSLLDAGQLRSGADYYRAAIVFQHGTKSEDFLMAHTLAIIAGARGRSDATWIASATLDRYLQSIGQKQIYGTQFATRPGQSMTQEPYDRTIVSDSLRSALGVPVTADQEKQRQQYQAAAKGGTKP